MIKHIPTSWLVGLSILVGLTSIPAIGPHLIYQETTIRVETSNTCHMEVWKISTAHLNEHDGEFDDAIAASKAKGKQPLNTYECADMVHG